ncbi:MAG: parvulin peptidyl-prolyl isomerase [Verrucomicrobia bacterium]|nr:MAG: parvulin peptidyl-prolyl isomerase [Verrucomicrobiota bacterium]
MLPLMKTARSLLVLLALLAFAQSSRAELVNGIKAIVQDSVITAQEVYNLAAPAIDVLRRQYRAQPEVLQKKLSETLDDSLDQLIERQLILQDFKSAGYNLPESIITEAVEERIRTRYGDRAKLIKTLQGQGLTFEKFRQQMRDQFIVEALRGKNISSEVIISPHKIESYYLAHKDKYRVEDEIKLRMIVLNRSSASDTAARQLADEILRKLKEGAAFAEMASVYSQGSQRSRGGDWDWVERSVLRKELAEVAFALKPGAVSDVIETPDACYLMLVENKKPAHTKALVEVRDEIEHNMLAEERARLSKLYIERLKKKTFVRYFRDI